MRNPAIATIQDALLDLGYKLGSADGRYGPRTRTAVDEWQAAGGAPAEPFEPLEPLAASKGIRQGKAGYLVDAIVVHCSATQPGWMAHALLSAQVAEIRRWHIEDRRWRDIGYQHVVGRAGLVLPGRRETEIGAGVEGHNRGVIHICLIGGHGSSASDPFGRHFTAEQDRALRDLISSIRLRTPIRRISGHNEHASKACPGFHVPTWLQGA